MPSTSRRSRRRRSTTPDLAEILGNLVENASRFARKTIRVSAVEERGKTPIAVTDDGPGIPEESQPAAIARGNRLDMRGEGRASASPSSPMWSRPIRERYPWKMPVRGCAPW